MATSLSRYLRLKLDSNLTANAKYNLERIDALGSTFITDSANTLNVRSESDIAIEPNSADLGGTGSGGDVSIGNDQHEVDMFEVFATLINFSAAVGILDSATSGTKYLRMKYDSTLSGSVDTASDRTLSFDLNGADRSLILGGDLSLLGNSLSVSVPGPLAFTYPSGYGSPGQLWTGDGSGGWIWTDAAGGGDVVGYSTTWLNVTGTSKTVTHNLNSNNVEVSIYDENSEQILIDDTAVSTVNSIQLTASEAPASSWTIVVHAK